VFNTAPPLRHPSILDGIRRWYRNWSAAREGAFELQCAGAAEVGRIAQELGLSSFELRALVSHPDEPQAAGEAHGWGASGTESRLQSETRSRPALNPGNTAGSPTPGTFA